MPTASLPSKLRRTALAALSRDTLTSLSAYYGLDVGDRRVVANHVDGLNRSRTIEFADLLARLSREELKTICDALELPSDGREKQLLIERILGTGDKSSSSSIETTSKKTNGKTPRMDGNVAIALEVDPSEEFSREQLERYLWAAADILRGSIDSSDYKNFIFGLLFLKRLSDRFDEECDALIKEGIDPEQKDEHQFFVPKRARWSQIQKAATNLGDLLNKASEALEEENSEALEGVLAGIDYNDERKLGDSKNRDSVLHRLIQHFSAVNLRNDNLSEPDLLGRAYEYLIEKFADDAGKKGGEFYTPNMVVRLMVELLEPKEGMRICDPTCGSGGMLIQSAKYITAHDGRAENVSLFGQEKNLGTWAICKMNMLLHGFPDARIEKGDTIRDPKLLEGGELMLFDRVIANPPFSLEGWGIEVAEHDSHGRFRFGVPPKTKGDLAFVQHMVATLNVNGKMAVVMPHGVLFRGASEGKIREGMLREDLIEAVVGLPTNLFYGTGIPAAIIVINRDKDKTRKGKVLFVEASREFREGSAQNYLRDEDVSKIANTVRMCRHVDRYARVVDSAEIERNDWNLNISRYVETAEAEVNVDVASAVAKLRATEAARDQAKAVMDKFLQEAGMTPKGWTVTTVGDVATLQRGFDLPVQQRRPGDIPVVASNGPVGYHSVAQVKGPGVITGRSGTIGKVFYYNRDFWPLNTTLYVCDFHANDPLYVAWLLRWLDLQKYAASTGVPSLNRNFVHPLQIPLPPVLEQRKIAAILSSVDAVIENTERVVEQLQVVKRAAMHDLLTRGLPGRHVRFKRTEIGEIPEEWRVVTLNEVALVQTGVAKNKRVESDIELPYLRVANVQDGHVDLAEMKTIKVEASEVERYSLRRGDVLFTEGGDADKLGRGCVWQAQIDPCLHQNHIFAVRTQQDVLRPQFLAYWAGSPRGKQYFLSCAKQTTNLASINSTQLKALPVPLASIDEQSEIIQVVGAIDQRIQADFATRDRLLEAKASLMSVLLTGELRVTPDKDAA